MPSISGVIFSDANANGSLDKGDSFSARPVLLFIVNAGAMFPLPIQSVLSDANGNYTFVNLPAGTYRVRRESFPDGYVCSNDGGKGFFEVVLADKNITSINIGSKHVSAPTPPPLPPPVPNPTGKPVWSHGIGACAWLSQVVADDANAAKNCDLLKSLGVSLVRAFAPSCKKGGNFDTGDDSKVKRLLSRGIKYVGMFGCPEKDEPNTTFDLGDWQRYFDGVAKWRNGNSNIIVELNNEINLTQYLPIHDTQNGGKFSPKAVSFLLQIAKIARASLGTSAFIVGPSVGWQASTDPHLSYQKALIDGGLLSYVNAINTHLYFTTAPQMELALSSYRSWVPKDFPIFLTETNFHGTQPSNYAHVGSLLLPIYVKYGVTPFVYRYCPTGSNSMDAIDLTDGKGTINSVVAKTWGLA
jgi:hypothetical protein